ncbi:hypothetical protein [Dyadobacter sp. CY347]|uniref:hypothetical protein n=1 Tax=Dyadobacter sp. CY347 TaxID=2909336 RepID=UPI001F468AB3|nr:hypothetical protein [Dyadobacter sp. CY347]MCF2486709.1 hypothetical protein [Dyadobacter sp. CY347]
MSGVKGRQLIPFANVMEIRNENGKRFINRTIGNRDAMLTLLVKGSNSLLFNDHTKIFYIEKNDSLLVIAPKHVQRALPIIFGKELVQAYYIKSNIRPLYSARYLKNLTVYANEAANGESFIFEESMNQFKTTVRIGPYVGYGFNKTAFDINAGTVKGRVAYRKTEFNSSSSIPLGLRIDLDLFKRVGIELGAYFNKTKAENIFLENTGFHSIPFPQSILIPKKYDTDLKTTGFLSSTMHFDLAMNVVLNRDERNKFKPYAFAGPTIAIMLRNEIKQGIGYQEDPQSEMAYFHRWSKLDSKKYLVGLNAGLAADYAITKRITLNASAKFTGGIYPKIRNRTFLPKTQNDTSMPESGFGMFDSSFWHSYDQYLRMVSVGTSATYTL